MYGALSDSEIIQAPFYILFSLEWGISGIRLVELHEVFAPFFVHQAILCLAIQNSCMGRFVIFILNGIVNNVILLPSYLANKSTSKVVLPTRESNVDILAIHGID